ncbi:zinc finger protein CONSTANS-LIKE 6 [Cucurbita pepo subsp. pepo]|uniref:zinc finger protein CONSTANS-LIKE 6 n=1 Tax=Cucurbita pepo subsp. pepo TaxID=3664 RepID=UPI000C9D3E4B|nr:zinc finger protein CONSTANS-LIKE 6 [Cucurbita pepo subsp. pepo]
MGYSSLLKSPKKEGAEEEQEVPNSIWDDFKAFFELSNEEKLPLQQQENFSIVNGGPLNWDLMDHHSNHQFSLSETKTNHSGHGDGVEAEVFSRVVPKACSFDGDGVMESKKKASLNLNLNYEEVSEAWSGRGSLWAAGGSSPSNPTHNVYMGEVPRMEEERTRRVLRYREKRLTRLFSNKIRYQVRKLNAQKRPRIKGRFVKTV